MKWLFLYTSKFLFLTFFFHSFTVFGSSTTEQILSCDLVAFSYNRPMQLYAFLESLEEHTKNLQNISVIYRVDPFFISGYEIVKNRFSYVRFFCQESQNFKDLVLDVAFGVFGQNASHIIFAVDDIIITDKIDFQEGIKKLQNANAYGLYYRLGKNINFCGLQNFPQEIPCLTNVGDGYFSWDVVTASLDWGYSNSLDLTLYKKEDIQNEIAATIFTGPNELEGRWKMEHAAIGICPEKSKMINIVLNTVADYVSFTSRAYSPLLLNRLFLEGKKIDIAPFYKITNNSPHVFLKVDFKPRA